MASKNDLIHHLATELEGVTKKLAGEAVDAIFHHIEAKLAGGERVQIPGFGAFEVSVRKERQGRNPQTGEPMTIAASKGVRFKPGKALKDAVNG
ncbi:MAG: HU family DNA-binding protein [Acidobacteriota bacterium]